MRSRTLLTVSVLTVPLIFMTAVSLPTWAQTQTASEPQGRAERLVEIADRLTATLIDMLRRAQDRGMDTTAASSLFDDGLESLDAAKAALAAGSYEEAIDKAREGLGKLRESLTTLRQAWRDLLEERAASHLQSLIDRMRAVIQRIRERLGAPPSSVPRDLINRVKSHLNAADGQLKAAESNLKAGNTDQAIDRLKKTREDMKAAFEGIREIAAYVKEDRISGTVERLTSAADKLETLLQRAADKGISVGDLQERLSTALELLSSAQSKVASGDFYGAVTDLRQATSQIRITYKDLVSRVTGG